MLKLFWFRTLTLHYVAEDPAGYRWLIPVTPMSPNAWDRRERYLGNYTLTRCPEYVERFYQPCEEGAYMTLAEQRRAALEAAGLGPRPRGGKRPGSGAKPKLRPCAKCGRMVSGRAMLRACPHQ